MLKLLWDQSPADKDVFVAFDGNDALHTFLVNPDGNEGISCVKLGQTKVGAGQVPALLLSGEVTLQTSGGKLVKMTLSTHEISPNISGAHSVGSISVTLMISARNACFHFTVQDKMDKGMTKLPMDSDSGVF